MSQTKTVRVAKEVHLQRFNDKNRAWYQGYEEWLNNHPKEYADKSKLQMLNNAINLLATFPNVSADELSITSIEEFIGGADTASNNNNKVNFTRNFFIYLVQKEVSLSFSPDDLKRYLFNRKDIKEDSKEEKQALTIEQIILIRNALRTDYVRLFMFEMVYQYGLTLKELQQCVDKNYDFENRTFSLRGREKPVRVNGLIHQMIVSKPKLLRPVNFSTNQARLSEIGKKLQELGQLDRIVRWKDVEETRNVNFFKCPGCGEIYENTPDNWAIIQYELDESKTKWIVCINTCAKGKKHE